MAQVTEHLHGKCKTLSSNPNTTKKKKKKFCIFSMVVVA
jgi:hypothetical protein